MTSWRSFVATHPRGVAAGVCAAAGFIVFQFFGNAVRGYIDTASVFWWWGFQWFNPSSETEHGPLILAVAGWVFWRNLRRSRADAPASPDPQSTLNDPRGAASAAPAPALAAMIAGLAIHALGYAVQQTRVSIFALLVFTWGVCRLAGGRRWGRAAAFPLLLLLFAVPVEFLEAVGFHLRLAVIATTEWIARAAGIEVVRNGTQLFAPDGGYQYDVAAACSGVRSLMALLALSLLIGYLQLRTWRARTAVFILAFPLTFLGNVVRIAAIVLAGEGLGQQAGIWVHDWAGFLVFVVVLGGVQLAAGGLARVEAGRSLRLSRSLGAARRDRVAAQPEASLYPRHFAQGRARRPAEPPSTRGLAPAWLAAGFVLLAAGATAGFTRMVDDWAVQARAGVVLDDEGKPANLPAFIGTEWIGQAAEVTAVERELLPADTGFARRTYVSLDDRSRQVFLSIVLSGRDRTSIHRPELCLVGQGWTIQRRTDTTFAHPAGGRVPAAVLHLSREVVDRTGMRRTIPSIFVYWFVGHETVVTTTAARMWHTALNRLKLNPDRWAYVVAQTLVHPSEDDAVVLARVQEVLQGTLPVFQPAPGRQKKG